MQFSTCLTRGRLRLKYTHPPRFISPSKMKCDTRDTVSVSHEENFLNVRLLFPRRFAASCNACTLWAARIRSHRDLLKGISRICAYTDVFGRCVILTISPRV